MHPTISVGSCLDEGVRNLKENFWPFILVVIIISILESFGNSSAVRQGMDGGHAFFISPVSGGFISFIVAVFIKPVFDFGGQLLFVRGNRGEDFEVADITEGFSSKELFIDIVLANLMIVVLVILGFICLILPGIYIACRLVLASYLVMDKGLAPKQALKGSWELMRDFWPQVILMGLIAAFLCIFGLILFVVGIFPAVALIKAMFASFYQKVIDAHEDDFLRSLGIKP